MRPLPGTITYQSMLAETGTYHPRVFTFESVRGAGGCSRRDGSPAHEARAVAFRIGYAK